MADFCKEKFFVTVFVVDVLNWNNNERKNKNEYDIDTVINAVVVINSVDGTKFNVLDASKVTMRNVLKTVSQKYGLQTNINYGNFDLKYNSTKFTGTSSASLARLGGYVVISDIRKYGTKEVVGYVVSNSECVIAKINKSKLVDAMENNGIKGQNFSVVKQEGKQSFISLNDASRIMPYYIGVPTDKLSKPVHTVPEKPPTGKVDKYIPGVFAKDTERSKRTETPEEIEKKKSAIAKLKCTRLGRQINDSYCYEAIKYLAYLCRKHSRYDYLLDPNYTYEQMIVLQRAYRKGIDISKFNDPHIPSDEMSKICKLIELEVWDNVDTSKLIR